MQGESVENVLIDEQQVQHRAQKTEDNHSRTTDKELEERVTREEQHTISSDQVLVEESKSKKKRVYRNDNPDDKNLWRQRLREADEKDDEETDREQGKKKQRNKGKERCFCFSSLTIGCGALFLAIGAIIVGIVVGVISPLFLNIDIPWISPGNLVLPLIPPLSLFASQFSLNLVNFGANDRPLTSIL